MAITSTTVDPGFFEAMYRDAQGDPARIPWADLVPSPALVNWLNAVAPSLVRCGSRVAVVGCGLGDDARELIARGYDVTAFDWSKVAVDWARDRDPANANCYHHADLFHLPSRWRHRFDLVVEINTIQSLPQAHQGAAFGNLESLLSPRGHLLMICRHSETPVHEDAGPPWAITAADLRSWAASCGLVAEGPIAPFLDDETPPVSRMRVLFHRL